MRPFEAAIEMLDAIYGIGRRTAEDILAEIGVDMSRWPRHHHIASWAKSCPGNHESAGKRHSGRTGKGNRWLRAILVEASMNITRKSDSYYAALYHRIAARRGKKRAHVAVAHSLLVAIYHMLKEAPCTTTWARTTSRSVTATDSCVGPSAACSTLAIASR